jgi:hypothetical protein
MNTKANGRIMITFLLLMVFGLCACGTLDISSEPTVARNEPVATATAVEQPSSTPVLEEAATTTVTVPTVTVATVAAPTGAPVNLEEEVVPETPVGFPTPVYYRNEETGISFSYPDDWTMEEEANVIVLRYGSISLRIAYRGVGEQVTLWTRTGIPAGDAVVLDSPVSFLGQTLSKNGLVYEDKLKAVFYGGRPVCIVKSDRMDFNITLEDLGSDYLALDIPNDVLHEVESILASFEVVSTEDGPPNELSTYVNSEYGFSLQYPPTWTAVEVNDEAFVGPGSRSVQLSQGAVTLVVGYRRAGEDTIAMGGGAQTGDFESRGTVFVGDNHVPRQVLVFEGKDKAVFYGWEPGSHIGAGWNVFAPRLVDFAQVDYRDVELSQEVQNEADLILSSLEVSCRDG